MCVHIICRMMQQLLFVDHYFLEIDECAENSSGCSHGCLNTNGSYVCLCPLGYQLMPNKHTCIGQFSCTVPVIEFTWHVHV